MPNGNNTRLFLSCYVSSPGRVGLYKTRHDQAVALWRIDGRDVEVVRYWELERKSGHKHHRLGIFTNGQLEAILSHLLATVGLNLQQIDEIWGLPNFGSPSRLQNAASRHPGMALHSLSHLYSALLLDLDRFRQSKMIGIAIDGVPDLLLESGASPSWYAGGYSAHGDLVVSAVESPAALYSAAHFVTRLEPGTLMALAEASKCHIPEDISDLENRTYFGSRTGLIPLVARMRDLISYVEKLLGEDPASCASDERFSVRENAVSAVMKLIQRASETVAIRNVERLLTESSFDPSQTSLALAGGYALNCPTNSRIIQEFGFRELVIPPGANDSGQALGLGLLAMSTLDDFSDLHFRLENGYLGDNDLDLASALDEWHDHIESVGPFDSQVFVTDLVRQPVAWVAGRAEFGPRALGHRSLLGDPRQSATKDILNEVKGRQWWRPVAPIVLDDYGPDWFENYRTSPYMLEVFHVPSACRASIPAVVHLDGSARIQSLRHRDDSVLYRAVDAFRQATGIPIVANTSLNDKGAPMVDSASAAIRFCLRHGLSVVYVNGTRIALETATVDALGSVATGDLYEEDEAAKRQLLADCASRGISPEVLVFLRRAPERESLLDAGPSELSKLQRLARFVANEGSSLFDIAEIDA